MNETVAAVNQPKTQFKDYPDVLTVQQTAELLSVCKNTIYQAAAKFAAISGSCGAGRRDRVRAEMGTQKARGCR